MASEAVTVALIGTIGVVTAPVLLAVVNHLLKQRDEERAEARKVAASRAYWRSRAAKAERALHGCRQRLRIARRARPPSP